MTRPFRVIDTGLREARENIAFDEALIEAHKDGAIPDTIRFLRFPPSALVGRHQAIGREINVEHCKANGIAIGRRITGGGTLYLDEGQIGWELVFGRNSLGVSDLGVLTQKICEAAAAGLSTLGIDARFRPRSDIEVDGQKLCGTGGFFDGDTLFFQGTLLIDFDPSKMIGALKLPAPPSVPEGEAPPKPRMTTLRALLGGKTPDLREIQDAILGGLAEGLGIEPARGEITADEEARAIRLHAEEIGTDDFVYEIDAPDAGDGVHAATEATPGGTVSAYLRLEGPQESRVREVLLSGDFFVTPPRVIYDLEASLRGVLVAELGAAVDGYFSNAEVGILTVPPASFRSVIEKAAAA
ncbi:MAG: lipoate--protein ligase family protein [Alphaproteobacteria bacterium]|nr:lipoate--protein ligase family protein [Alphaproteobacteria bacterium]